jgi:hypothetical protein
VSTNDLMNKPLIPVPAIGRVLGVGNGAVTSAATRLGIEFARRPNGRAEATFAQASQIVAALNGRLT